MLEFIIAFLICIAVLCDQLSTYLFVTEARKKYSKQESESLERSSAERLFWKYLNYEVAFVFYSLFEIIIFLSCWWILSLAIVIVTFSFNVHVPFSTSLLFTGGAVFAYVFTAIEGNIRLWNRIKSGELWIEDKTAHLKLQFN